MATATGGVLEALERQFMEMDIAHASLYTPARAQFLREFSSILPWKSSMTYLGNSGTEAVEAAMKVAFKYTKRRKFIAMERSYHGKTMGSVSLTHSQKYRKSFSGLLYPEVTFVPFGDAEALRRVPDLDSYAAVFVEPVQGEGGVNIPPGEYLKEVREVCDDNGILMVTDEVQSGMGRTGKWWAHQHFGIVPDILTAGKGIGGGIPMSATSGRKEFMEVLEVGGEQSSTTGGNPLACAAGTEVIRQLKGGLLERVDSIGRVLRDSLTETVGDHRLVKEVRGMGLMNAVELRIRFLPVLMSMIDGGGAIPLYSGINTIRLLPPYVITRESVEIAASAMEGALERQVASAREGGA
ncbi:aminotransferase class III-fold pyridoxal phosphate-dependent enzyme [Thermogymnomonas acidicola]|uniref:aspartate aminotransferase family protein n=1 Tax=Thermogymnomonas acidicola TaxID=399579 RepID=UPI0014948CB5|nr:aminotransferase class III-fold pyridoxal phosphate-dependent enzyme [Thermogymnomonas acidicola]